MDMTLYEKITGREALRRLLDGEAVYAETGEKYKIYPSHDRLYYVPDPMHHEILSVANVNDVFRDDWYIKKPFDVRQAMRDKPDEWVAAFKTSENDWVKVGFDTSEFTVVGLELSNDAPIESTHDYFKVCVYGTDLDTCIPLDEVPVDAK